MYIYSKSSKDAFFDDLSYGYPMGIIWVSYGAHSHCPLFGVTFDAD